MTRLFFPQAILNTWVADETADLTEAKLVLRADQRVYEVEEAVRVLREVTGAEDAAGLVGRVKTTRYLQSIGAELLDTSMVVGECAYDVVPGFVGSETTDDEPRSTTDEDLLADFLSG